MKHIKKVITLLLAVVMTLAMSATAFAADPTNNRTVDTAISVSGLEANDSVTFYKVLKYDQDAAKTGGWSAAPGFTLTDAQIQKILGLDSNGKPVTITSENENQYGIDAALAAQIADMAEAITSSTEGAVSYTATADASGKAEKTGPEAGLYVATVTPAKAGTVYNPVFVGADYVHKETGDTSSFTVDLNDSYKPASMAKKSNIPLDKSAQDEKTVDTTSDNYDTKSDTVSVGDNVTFTVETTIPEFGDNYTNPVFKISDVLSTGLELDTTSIKVYAAKKADIAEANLITKGENTYAENPEPTKAGYTIVFAKKYLLDLNAAQDITIQYTAKVTSEAATSVNKVDNKVTVNYSNNPTDESGKGILKDITNHYTFDIDANVLGTEGHKGTEVVKVGIGPDGKEITETVELDNGKTIGALQGAEFELYTDAACENKYTNDILKSTSKIVSDARGYLTIDGESTPGIRGLDAGTYYLKETKAPDGYIKAQNAVKIEIIPTFQEKTYTETVNIDGKNVEVTYKANELVSYVVKIDDQQTANYTFTNEGPTKNDLTLGTYDDNVIGADGQIGATGAGAGAAYGKIQNTQGVELPSTGGIGTVIFYVLGAALVIGCGVVLVSRRRMQNNK